MLLLPTISIIVRNVGYMLRLARWREQRYQEAAANPSPMIQRLSKI